MKISVRFEGLERVQQQIARLGAQGVQQAASDALNDAAFKVRRDYQQAMRQAFDRPTPYIVNSIRVEKATPAKLVAIVEPRYPGGKGVEPTKVLRSEIEGGKRVDKRSEVALRKAGLLPNGYRTAIPRDPYPGSEDAYGNLRGGFIVRLLSYFQAFSEVGYRANASKRKRERMANYGRTERGFKTIRGVQFFVAFGKLRGGRTEHLQPGIYAKTGIHGSSIRPVLIFVRDPTYRKRLDLDKIAAGSDVQAHFARRMRYRIRAALGE